jgi:hypothetical protein
MSTVDGIKGKTTMQSIAITGNLLVNASCVESDVTTELIAKEIELDYYNLSFPISLCELKSTWLASFATKYRDEKEVYIESLIPYLAEKVGDEVKAKVYNDILAEAVLDADVAKVVVAGALTTGQEAYNNILTFVNGLSDAFTNKALDYDEYSYYKIHVSTKLWKLLLGYLGDKVTDAFGVQVGGFLIRPNAELTLNEMICSPSKNFLVIFDDSSDLSKVKVINKEWLNKSYIVTGLAFKGSYVDSSEIVISVAV